MHDLQIMLSPSNARTWFDEPPEFIHFLPIGIYACDAAGRFLWFNFRAEDLWGRTPRPGETAAQLWGTFRIEIDGHDTRADSLPLTRAPRPGEFVSGIEARIERADGSAAWAAVHVNPIRDEHGQLLGTINCLQETTDLRHADEELRRGRFADSEGCFRTLLDCLPAAIYMADAEGRLIYFNRAAVELSGRTPKPGSDRWCVSWKLYWPDGTPLPHNECPMAVTLKTGRPTRNVELLVERPDGTRVPVIPYPMPLYDSSGRMTGAVNMLIDISDRNQTENQKQKLLDELNHRIKNKVQMLHALLRMAVDDASNGEARSALINVSRRVSAIAAAQRVLYGAQSPFSFAVPQFVASVCADAEHSFGGNVTIRHSAEAGSLPNSSAMPLALILNELLSNAVRHGTNADGAALIRVKMSKTAGFQVLSVEDDGPGFDFEPPLRQSSGLGLVVGLAHQLGGTFEVARASGARCVVRFPADEDASAQEGKVDSVRGS